MRAKYDGLVIASVVLAGICYFLPWIDFRISSANGIQFMKAGLKSFKSSKEDGGSADIDREALKKVTNRVFLCVAGLLPIVFIVSAVTYLARKQRTAKVINQLLHGGYIAVVAGFGLILYFTEADSQAMRFVGIGAWGLLVAFILAAVAGHLNKWEAKPSESKEGETTGE